MIRDGRTHVIPKVITNDRPTRHEITCPCGGVFYAAPTAQYAHCSSGEIRCTVCHRQCRRFGKGYTCGPGCEQHD